MTYGWACTGTPTRSPTTSTTCTTRPSQPWKTQKNVREVLSRLYTGSEIGQGYHGDEDNGEQSAWYLFSSLGFYPLVMGSGEYAVGSPLFTKATVHLENGQELVVKAPKNSAKNVYVQGLKVNGKAWKSTSLPHSIISPGGVLEFDMGSKPSSWGTGKNAAPVSITAGRQGAVAARATSSRARARCSTTPRRRTRPSTSVDLPTADRAKAVQYTLTSAERAKAPQGWVLQGSSDGTTWKDLDKRSGQSFTWDRQTRAFSVAAPGSYTKYRLVLDGEATLAEVELLG